jgi:hypothetical protein
VGSNCNAFLNKSFASCGLPTSKKNCPFSNKDNASFEDVVMGISLIAGTAGAASAQISAIMTNAMRLIKTSCFKATVNRIAVCIQQTWNVRAMRCYESVLASNMRTSW